jgi:hypothetical protein
MTLDAAPEETSLSNLPHKKCQWAKRFGKLLVKGGKYPVVKCSNSCQIAIGDEAVGQYVLNGF